MAGAGYFALKGGGAPICPFRRVVFCHIPTDSPSLMDRRTRVRLDKVGFYRIGKAIGRGNFAVVRVARHEIAKTKVALKIIDRRRVDDENMVKIEREIRILKSLDHPNLIKLYEVMQTEQHLYMVTEFCSGGELYEVLIERGRTPEDEARRLFGQTTSALQYLHRSCIVHRDLKAENILIDKHNDIKIIDFGFSNFQKPNELLRTWCGSPPYAAPELLLGKEYDGLKADIWSLGVLLYILVTGGFPFPGDSVDKLKRAVLSGQVKIPYWVSVECSDLIRKMLVLNPGKRYGVNSVAQHRWLSEGTSKTTSPVRCCLNSSLSSSSLAPNTRQRLNPTILLFMQTHGKWTEEQIIEAIFKKDFDNPIYSTYELLCDKVGRDSLDACGADDHPRRGSRGSIISGKAVVDNDTLTPTISAHQLAQLNLSSPSDSESGDSSSSEVCDDSPSFSSRRSKRNRGQFGAAVTFDAGNKNEHRRHTLCASEQILSPEMVAQIPVGSPLHQAVLNQATLAALAAQSGPSSGFNPLIPLLPGLSALPPVDYSTMLPVPNNERRASAGENLLQPGIESLSHVVGTNSTVEEEGQGYLNKFGGKRNTVHGALPLGPSSSPVARHSRSPYSKTPSMERRSSWASPTITTLQQQAKLERIYKNAISSGNSDLFSIQSLQKEFQQLGKMASGSITRSPTATTPASSNVFGCPRISITDEHNRSTLAPSSSSFDPVSMFEQKANEVVYGQRPATVIGFASTSKSRTSSPDQGSSSDNRVKSFISSLPVRDLVEDMKSTLKQLHIQFEETNEVVYLDHEMHRLSLAAGVEIGVITMPPDDKSHVEFAIISSDSPSSEILCEELVSRLQIRDPSGTLE